MKYLILLVAITFSFVTSANATLIDNGDGTLTDTNTNLMWLQDANYSGQMAWSEAKSWADNLSYAGFDDWRLPYDLNDCFGYNCTESEMGNLYFLENITTSSPGLFMNLQNSDDYWTASSYYFPIGPNASYPIVKTFNFSSGFDSEYHDIPYTYNYAMSVRVVPEPISSTLFIVGGATLGFRRFLRKKA